MWLCYLLCYHGYLYYVTILCSQKQKKREDFFFGNGVGFWFHVWDFLKKFCRKECQGYCNFASWFILFIYLFKILPEYPDGSHGDGSDWNGIQPSCCFFFFPELEIFWIA